MEYICRHWLGRDSSSPWTVDAQQDRHSSKVVFTREYNRVIFGAHPGT